MSGVVAALQKVSFMCSSSETEHAGSGRVTGVTPRSTISLTRIDVTSVPVSANTCQTRKSALPLMLELAISCTAGAESRCAAIVSLVQYPALPTPASDLPPTPVLELRAASVVRA